MANFLTKLFTAGAGTFVEKVGGIVDGFHLSGEEKEQFKIEFEKVLQARDAELEQTMRQELQAKERILVAELTHGDSYTKRARPTVVYFGLVVIAWNYSIVPLLIYALELATTGTPALPVPSMELPAEFWYGWSGIVATWSVGRTMERRGSQNNLLTVINGPKDEKPTMFNEE